MQKKLSRSNIAVLLSLGLSLIVLSGFANAALSASHFSLGIQFSDSGCTDQFGEVQSIDSTKLGSSDHLISLIATDGNHYDPDCVRLQFQKENGEFNQDFRICLQMADYVSVNPYGLGQTTAQEGTERCTPWASEGGGWSDWASDQNSYDFDGGRIILRTRSLPSGMRFSDARLGVQVSDGQCTAQFSPVHYTPWLSTGGGFTAWTADSNGYDPDCVRVYLEPKSNQLACTETQQSNNIVSSGDELYSAISGSFTSAYGAGQAELTGKYSSWANASAAGEGAQWISYKSNTSQNGSGPAAGTVYAFTETLTIPQGAVVQNGSVSVLADDGVRIFVNDREILSQSTVSTPPHSSAATGVFISADKLKAGDNVFTFELTQDPNHDRSPYGLAYRAWINYTLRTGTCGGPTPPPPSTPPPGGDTPSSTQEPPIVISCTFTATPATIVKNIGSSRLAWACTDQDGVPGSGTVSISDDNPQFPDLGSGLPPTSNRNVSPQETTRFVLTYPGAAPAMVTVQVTTSTFGEDNP